MRCIGSLCGVSIDDLIRYDIDSHLAFLRELVEGVCNNPCTRVFQGCYKKISGKIVPALPNVSAVGEGIPRREGTGGVEWH